MSRRNIRYSSQHVIERKRAFLLVWCIVSILSIIILLFPIFFSPQTVLNTSPQCISKSTIKNECSLCGMTRAFIEISHGNIQNGLLLNRGSVALFFGMALNIMICISYSVYQNKRLFQSYMQKYLFE